MRVARTVDVPDDEVKRISERIDSLRERCAHSEHALEALEQLRERVLQLLARALDLDSSDGPINVALELTSVLRGSPERQGGLRAAKIQLRTARERRQQIEQQHGWVRAEEDWQAMYDGTFDKRIVEVVGKIAQFLEGPRKGEGDWGELKEEFADLLKEWEWFKAAHVEMVSERALEWQESVSRLAQRLRRAQVGALPTVAVLALAALVGNALDLVGLGSWHLLMGVAAAAALAFVAEKRMERRLRRTLRRQLPNAVYAAAVVIGDSIERNCRPEDEVIPRFYNPLPAPEPLD